MMWRHAFALASRSGVDARLSILIFHRVHPRADPLFPGEPDAASFDALIAHLRARFNMLPLGEAVRALAEGTLPPRAAAITFDDGYADNLAVALPILRRHGVPATLFVASGFMDGGCMWNDVVIEALRATRREALNFDIEGIGRVDVTTIGSRRAAIDRILAAIKHRPPDERAALVDAVRCAAGTPQPAGLMLDRDGLRAIAAGGFDIGAHTVSHPILAALPPDRARDEIVRGKHDLERVLDTPVTLFAYPNGRPGADFTEAHVAMVREAGFRAAVTTAPGAASRASDLLQLPRFTPWSRTPWRFDFMMLRNLRHSPAELRVACTVKQAAIAPLRRCRPS